MSCPLHGTNWQPDCQLCAKLPDFYAGQFYGRRTPTGKLEPIGAEPPGDAQVEAWICRRVADFPGQRAPAAGKVTECTECGAAIVYNLARMVLAPKICMQCAMIRPLPIDS